MGRAFASWLLDTGGETKERTQIQLIERLAALAEIKPNCEILDVGCGFGGSSIYLAKNYQAQATGIKISSVQVDMADEAAGKAQVNANFLLMDAEMIKFNKLFDVVWSVESISYYENTAHFFASAAKLLRSDGTLAIIDWFKKKDLQQSEYEKYIQPIEKGMLVELRTMEEYETQMKSNGLQILNSEVLNKHAAKTWDLCLDIIKNKSFWELAAQHGSEFVHFLTAFQAMRAGFASGNFIYGLVIARKT